MKSKERTKRDSILEVIIISGEIRPLLDIDLSHGSPNGPVLRYRVPRTCQVGAPFYWSTNVLVVLVLFGGKLIEATKRKQLLMQVSVSNGD